MAIWAIVPVKPLRKSKPRLSDVLSEDERALLNFTMLSQTLRTLKSMPAIEQILVVSRDSSVLALAREYGARTVQEDGQPDLTLALRRAVVVAKMYNAESLLILPADLPLLSERDIEKMLLLAKEPPFMVIAPDRHNDGTNAIYLNPPDIIDCKIGAGSYAYNMQQAKKKNVPVEICQLTSLGLDIDLPEDLDLLNQIESSQVDT
ncbi:MAG: 2-phospho-L-lactate guanylyltransferase [Bellilinea sp.]